MGERMRSSVPLYDRLAPVYDDHFAAPHRRAYDDLSWEVVVEHLPAPGARPVVDAGCGVGRWAGRLVGLGHPVIGVEQAPAMAAAARARGLGAGFTVLEGSMDAADVPAGAAAAVLAMGSLQYTPDPVATLRRLAGWAAPGAPVVVLVDSLVALTVELVRAGRPGEAADRVRTRSGVWAEAGLEADLHLFDARTLAGSMESAGLVGVEVRGLLVGWTMFGRDGFLERLAAEPAAVMDQERGWSTEPSLADLGKQLLAVGHRPVRTA